MRVKATHPQNNFDCIRAVAAIMVWYGHCFALYAGEPDPLSRLTGGVESLGSLGVKIFFIVSGYFITASYARHHRVLTYIRNRALRLLPALIGVVLVCAFLLGPAVSSLSTISYFSNAETWRYLYTMLIFPVQYDLPGVFNSNPMLHAVNGSLWSLQHELRCYGYVLLLGVLGLLRLRAVLILFIGLWLARLYGTGADFGYLPHMFFLNRWSWGKTALALNLVILFCGGALVYLARAHIAFRWKYLLAIMVPMMVSLTLPYGDWLFELCLIYAIICLGFLPLPFVKKFGRFGDFSYGIYLYAFPAQQLILYIIGAHENFILFCITSFCLTLFCAVVSWHYIEKRALASKA